jgi:hypothetical protein
MLVFDQQGNIELTVFSAPASLLARLNPGLHGRHELIEKEIRCSSEFINCEGELASRERPNSF